MKCVGLPHARTGLVHPLDDARLLLPLAEHPTLRSWISVYLGAMSACYSSKALSQQPIVNATTTCPALSDRGIQPTYPMTKPRLLHPQDLPPPSALITVMSKTPVKGSGIGTSMI